MKGAVIFSNAHLKNVKEPEELKGKQKFVRKCARMSDKSNQSEPNTNGPIPGCPVDQLGFLKDRSVHHKDEHP